EQIAESARAIAETGRELHKRLATFVEPFAKAGRQLGSAVDAYNQAARSFDARLAPKVRELAEMGASSGRDASPPVLVESVPHPPLAELVDQAESDELAARAQNGNLADQLGDGEPAGSPEIRA